MRGFHKTLGGKIFLFGLCMLTLATACASVAGAVWMAYTGVYEKTQEYMTQSRMDSQVENDSYAIVYNTIHDRYFVKEFDLGRTNLHYALYDTEGTVVNSNLELSDEIKAWDYTLYYYVYEITEEDGWEHTIIETIPIEAIEVQPITYIFKAYLPENLTVGDEYRWIQNSIELAYSLRYAVFPIGAVSAILCLVPFILLLCGAGRQKGHEGLYPGYFHCIPFDILSAAVGFLLVFGFEVAMSLSMSSAFEEIFGVAAYAVLGVVTLLLYLMSFACRVKEKTLLQNTVTRRVLVFLWKAIKRIATFTKGLVQGIPLVWKTAAVMGISFLVDGILFTLAYEGNDVAVVLWIIKCLVIGSFCIYTALGARTLQKAAHTMAKGELSYRLNTSNLYGDWKRHGEDLNSISAGMELAVEEKLKSERMKAELVTNVSHDIKTPLTSIINYASLLCNEVCENEKHHAYAEVLVRKSEHLKRLLEDLVEISKANTGNLEVNLQKVDAAVMLQQTAGEFQQRCEQANLQLITSLPNEKIEIMADGRRLWRVFENLLGNALKYSMPHTRVYFSLTSVDGQAVFTLRNTSREMLNISQEELSERFVRGDAARHGEGSGLGLSIAKSLTELQNGSMKITVDGDLFKVELKFAKV